MQKLIEKFKTSTEEKLNKISSTLEKALKFGVAAILIAIPLYPKFPFINVPGTYVSIRIEDFLILIVAVIWFLITLRNPGSFLKSKINQGIFIFLIVSLVSLLSAVFLTKTVVFHIGILHWVRRLEYFTAFFIGVASVKTEKDLAFYLKCVLIVVIIAGIYGMGQKYLYWPIITTQNNEYSKGVALRYTPGSHIPSTFAGHYDLATYLVLVFPVLFSLFFTLKEKVKKVLILFVISSGFWLLINAISRISVVSYFIGVSIALFLIRKYKAIPIVIIVSIVIMLFSPDLVGRYSTVIQVTVKDFMKTNKIMYIKSVNIVQAADEASLPKRRESSKNKEEVSVAPVFEDRSTSIRLNVEWPRAIRAFSKNPLLGTGFSSITLATDSHYLRLLGELGILGFLSFFIVFLRIAKAFLKALPLSQNLDLGSVYLAGIIGAVPGIFLNAVFIDVFEASKFATSFWLLLGFAVAIVKIKYDEFF